MIASIVPVPRPEAQPAAAPGAMLLTQITAGLATGSDLSRLLEQFLEPIVRLAAAQAGAVRLLSASGAELQLLCSTGLEEALAPSEQRVDRHCGACGSAADGQAPVWAAELSDCRARSRSAFFGGACQRMLVVPLQYRGELLGVCNLFFGADVAEPSAQVQGLLKSVGELLGLALHHARLEADQVRALLVAERQQMAADVHDSVAQQLTYVKMRLPLLEDAVRAQDAARALGYCDELRRATGQAHASLRGLITHLRAPMDPRGLRQALAASAEQFRRGTGAELEISDDGAELALAPEQELQVFHIVQEALANIARHAGARHAWLRLARRPGACEVIVDDDGAGVDNGGPPQAVRSGHFGLEIMRERALRLGGTIEVGAREGGGTRVRLCFPAAAAPSAGAA